jgi:cyclohexa-1,5-dienecarbonyl-CoA hydratase
MRSPVRTVEEREGAWLRVILDCPPGNLLSIDMVRALAGALEGAAAPKAAPRKWVTVEGAGAEFSFGAMIQEHVPGAMERVLPETHALLRQLLSLPCPTAALVQGRCLGGGFELALACDLIIADEDAILGLPEIALAAFPPAGSALLPLRVGAARAAEAIFSGASGRAEAWRDRGAVAIVAPGGRLAQREGEWFDANLAARSAVALAAAAQASRLTLRAAAEPAIAAAERLYLDQVLPTLDAAEGVAAFAEKRPPHWKHR